MGIIFKGKHNGNYKFDVEIIRPTVYLDTWAILDLAE